jgi:hypothetical protein
MISTTDRDNNEKTEIIMAGVVVFSRQERAT